MHNEILTIKHNLKFIEWAFKRKKCNEKLAGNSTVGSSSLKLLMNYEFSVLLVGIYFYILVKLCSHQPLKFSFTFTAIWYMPKASCLINSPLNSRVDFGAPLDSFLLPPHLLPDANASCGRMHSLICFFLCHTCTQLVRIKRHWGNVSMYFLKYILFCLYIYLVWSFSTYLWKVWISGNFEIPKSTW